MKLDFFFMVAMPTITTAVSRKASSTSKLQVDVYHASPVPVSYQGSTDLSFSPTAFTLVHSAHEAVLVDAPTLNETAVDIAEWIARIIPGKKLAYIYITHGHFDHFGAFSTIQARFPDARVVTTANVIQHMKGQLEPLVWDSFWVSLFPGLQKPSLADVSELPADGRFFLEQGYELQAIEVGESDTQDSTVLHVPDLGLVVGGDVVYGHCYQYLAENPTPELRAQWVASLEKVRKLEPRVVVPSHMQPDEGYGEWHLEETERYIEAWEGWLKEAKSWEELERLAKQEFPERIGDFILRYSAQSFFNATF